MKCAMCGKELYNSDSYVFVKKERAIGNKRVNDKDLLGAYKVQYDVSVSEYFYYVLDDECYYKLTHKPSFWIYHFLRKYKKTYH